ncbi:MAG: hypothetical protein AAF802_14540 [Planctomycetota bacterium]
MIKTESLSFSWTPWSISIGIIAIVVTIVVAAIACRRSNFSRSTVLLEGLRITLVVAGVILLGGPEWIQSYQPDEKPVVAVLWDDSGSMETRDVKPSMASVEIERDGEVPSGGAVSTYSRREAISSLTKPETWQGLNDRAEIVIAPFSNAMEADASKIREISNTVETTTAEVGTDISTPLTDLLQEHDQLLGVIIASDGDWNQGDSPAAAATQLRTKGVPVFAFPTGSDRRLPDVELISFDVPTFAIAGKRVRIPLTIESSLPRDHSATLTLKTARGETIEKQIRVAAMGRTAEFVEWSPEEIGSETLTVSLSPHSSEIRDDNNTMEAPIAIREEKLRVLVVESYPRWEYRYLRNALSRDPGVEVSCLLFHPSLDKRGGGNTDYIQSFPETKEELAKYDVVFVGDVGLEDEQLTEEQCDWLRGLVEQQASGLVFLPGMQGRVFSLLETELAELMPVVLDETQPSGWGSRTPQHFELSELGRRSLLTKLADTEDENLEVWANLPGFQWHAPVVRAKPGSETLAVHQETSNRYGRLPLLVTRTFGAGKVLFMGTDGAWRWRKGVEDKYHYRFWSQVVRWMAYRRNIAQGDSMRLYYSPERPRVRQMVTVNANVMESSGEPLSSGTVTLRVLAPSGKIETVPLKSDGGQWGAFSARFSPNEPGEHSLTLFCKETGDSLETKLYIQGESLEQIGKPARPEVLEEIARVTRGQVLSLDRVDDVTNWLAALPDPPPSVRRTALWSHPLVMGLFVVLITVFWIGRKGVGVI